VRILWWAERFWPFVGGIETLGFELIPVLQQMGHDVEVVTSHSAAALPDQDRYKSISFHRFPFLTALQQGNLRQIVETRRRLSALKLAFQPDLVHIHFSGPSPLFHWQTCDEFACPTLVTLHSLPPNQRTEDSLLVKTLAQADWISSVSAHMLGQVRSLVPAIDARSSVIYNGMADADIPSQSQPSSTPILLCIGRMVAWKRFDWAIDLFADICGDYETAQLVLIGDGVERTRLEEQVERLNLQSRVTFMGVLSQEEIFDHLRRSILVLLPSTAMENIPYVAAESSWMRCPVIASNVSGLPELIVDGQTGYLVPPTDKAMWLDRIRRILDDPTHREQLGQEARGYVRQKLSLDTCAAQYDALYHQIQEHHEPVH